MRSFLPNHRETPFPEQEPRSTTRRTFGWLAVIVVLVAFCVLCVVLWSAFVVKRAQGAPGEGAVLPLPDGVEVLSQATTCEPHVCTREFVVEKPGTIALVLADELNVHYHDKRDYDLHLTSRNHTYSSYCDGGKTCLLIGPVEEDVMSLVHPDLADVPPEAVVVQAIRRDNPG